MWRAYQRTLTHQEDTEIGVTDVTGDFETTTPTLAVDDSIDVEFEGDMDRVAQEVELLETQGISAEL